MRRILVLVMVVLALAGCRESSTSGSAIYFTACSACHGVDLSGGVGGPLVGNDAAELSDDEYRTVIREGTTDMPSNRSLSEQQLDTLIAYIRSVQDQ